MGAGAPAWIAYVDLVLEREALLARLRFGAEDPAAGLSVDAEELGRCIDELRDGDLEEAVRRNYADLVEPARAALVAELERGEERFATLVGRAGLDAAAAEVLAIVCAVELDSRRQRILVYAQDDVNRRWPTIETLLRIVGPGHDGPLALAPGGALRRCQLVELPEGDPWSSTTVRAHPTAVWWLRGADPLDPDLPPGAERLELPDPEGAGGTEVPLLLVHGGDRRRRRDEAVAGLGTGRLLVTPVPEGPGWGAVVRQATLDGRAVLLEVEASLPPDGRRAVEQAGHLRWAIATAVELPLDVAPGVAFAERAAAAAPLQPSEHAAAFGDEVPSGHRLHAEHVEPIQRVRSAVDGDFEAAVRRLSSGLLEGLAVRVRPERTWDDLVLPDDRIQALRDLTARYRLTDTVVGEWGVRPSTAGLVAIFSGPSGTGKTMAAEIIAGDLGLDLYRVDLPAVVSKWVGETEKNLERIFAAASSGNLVLFFDEADSIFGRRGEVSQANDRYANIEVSYLLQRLETYDGMVIMATNLQGNIDSAFLRRIHVAVDFPTPDAERRREIWAGCFPPTMPLGDVDLDVLAERFELAGGSIRSAAVSGAFLAADEGVPLSMAHLAVAVNRELGKLGRLVSPDLAADLDDQAKR